MEKNFKYNEVAVRTNTDENEMIWFAGIDVCGILDYSNPTQAIEKLDEDERKLDSVQDSSGQKRKTWTINEFGLYSLILSSRKPEAKDFKRWITHEVLPSIRRAGKYTTVEEKDREDQIQEMVKKIEKTISDRDDLRKKANDKTKDIDQTQAELMMLLKSDFRQRKIPFEN